METIRTNVKVRQLYREMKGPLAFDNFQDFIDYVIRTGLQKLQEAIVNRNIVAKFKKE